MGASCGSSGRRTCLSVVLEVRTGNDCLVCLAGVPLPKGEGILGVERFLRWAGIEPIDEDGLSGDDCLSDEAVRAIPSYATASVWIRDSIATA